MQSQQTHFFESNEAISALDVPGLVDRTEAACANLPHDEVTIPEERVEKDLSRRKGLL